MKNNVKFSNVLAAAALAALTVAGGAQAQTSTSSASSGSGYSMYAPGSTYIGANIGQSNYRLINGLGVFPSDKRKNSYSIYGGGYYSEILAQVAGPTGQIRLIKQRKL